MYNFNLLKKSRVLDRRKRFFMDVQFLNNTVDINSQKITAYLSNPGSMKGCLPQRKEKVDKLGSYFSNCWAYLSYTESKSRKYPWAVELLEIQTKKEQSFICVNTQIGNRLSSLQIEQNFWRGFFDYPHCHPEFSLNKIILPEIAYQKLKKSRIDFFFITRQI